MKKIFVLVLFSILFSGCWFSSNQEQSAVNNGKTAPNPNNPANDPKFRSNSNLVPYKGNVDPNRANQPGNQNMKVVKRNNANNKTKFGERNAPDNSTFKSTLGPDGAVETRTFTDHPQISKVVRKTSGNKKTLQVFLKTGKVYDLAPEKYPHFRNMHPNNILKAIGLAPNPQPRGNEPASEKKQSEENK